MERNKLRHIVERGIGPGTFQTRELDPWSDFIAIKSGLLVPSYALQTPRLPQALDLFSGCGGFSLGFIEAGFEVVAALDCDCTCMHTYLSNLGGAETRIVFVEPNDEQRWKIYSSQYLKKAQKEIQQARHPEHQHILERDIAALQDGIWGGAYRHYHPDKPAVKLFILGDVHKVSGTFILEQLSISKGELDCVFGSPPCQGFSSSGKRDVMDPRNSLVFDWARLVVEIQPKTCVMENVPGIVSMVTPEGLPIIDSLCRILEDGGMGTFNALKRSLLSSPNAGAIIKGKATQKSIKKEKRKKSEQLALV